MKWILAALTILLAALVLQSGLLAYAMYVLLGLLLLSRALARSWAEGLVATRTCRVMGQAAGAEVEVAGGLTAEEGDRVSVRVRVRNTGRLPAPWVLLEDVVPRGALHRRFPRLRLHGRRIHLGMVRPGGTTELRYQIECLRRGYYPVGPVIVETGDLFGLHRRYRVATEPRYLLVYPRVVPLLGYDLTSRRPIGDVRMTYRLYEDPTRISGVRPYEAGDPLRRIHWRATARSGALHSRVYEPSTLSGATLVLDFHAEGYHSRGEPYRSELAVTAVASLAGALDEMGQQVGLVTNGRSAAERIRREARQRDPRSRAEALAVPDEEEQQARRAPLQVPTRRGTDQLQRIREALAVVELNDGLTFAQLLTEMTGRIPRDATVVACLADVSAPTALALGNLRRQGLAVSVVLVIFTEQMLEKAHGLLLAEGIRDVRHLPDEASLPHLCRFQVDRGTPYQML